jgi:hypothetical protein
MHVPQADLVMVCERCFISKHTVSNDRTDELELTKFHAALGKVINGTNLVTMKNSSSTRTTSSSSSRTANYSASSDTGLLRSPSADF